MMFQCPSNAIWRTGEDGRFFLRKIKHLPKRRIFGERGTQNITCIYNLNLAKRKE